MPSIPHLLLLRCRLQGELGTLERVAGAASLCALSSCLWRIIVCAPAPRPEQMGEK